MIVSQPRRVSPAEVSESSEPIFHCEDPNVQRAELRNDNEEKSKTELSELKFTNPEFEENNQSSSQPTRYQEKLKISQVSYKWLKLLRGFLVTLCTASLVISAIIVVYRTAVQLNINSDLPAEMLKQSNQSKKELETLCDDHSKSETA